MEIEYAFLARAADISPDGTLSVLGTGFEVVRSRNFPRNFPLSVVVRLKNIVDSTRDMILEFDVFNTGGQSILDAPYVLSIEVGRQPSPASVVPKSCGNVVFGVLGLVIPEAGPYRLALRLTGENAVSRDFTLVAEHIRD